MARVKEGKGSSRKQDIYWAQSLEPREKDWESPGVGVTSFAGSRGQLGKFTEEDVSKLGFCRMNRSCPSRLGEMILQGGGLCGFKMVWVLSERFFGVMS